MQLSTKKLLNLFFWAVCMFFTNYGFAQFNGGTGTEADPEQIANVTQLHAMNTALDKHFILTQNAIGTTYQWINCDTNTPITNATNQTYTATVTGNYAVIVSNNSCVDTSVCTNIVVHSIDKNKTQEITVYPNPTSSQINFVLTKNIRSKINRCLVRVVFSSTLEAGNQKLNIANFEHGMYVLSVQYEDARSTTRVLKIGNPIGRESVRPKDRES